MHLCNEFNSMRDANKHISESEYLNLNLNLKQYIIHIKAYMACFSKVDIMLLKLKYITKILVWWIVGTFVTQNV